MGGTTIWDTPSFPMELLKETNPSTPLFLVEHVELSFWLLVVNINHQEQYRELTWGDISLWQAFSAESLT